MSESAMQRAVSTEEQLTAKDPMKLKAIRSEEQFEYLADEYQQLNAAYDLFQTHRVSFGMFMTKPWYYRIFVSLLDEAGSVKPQAALQPLLEEQRQIQKITDRAYLRPESQPRLHNGAIFEPLRHNRHPRQLLREIFRRHT